MAAACSRDTRVLRTSTGGRRAAFRPRRGEITAAHVLVATHSPLNRLFLQTKVAPYRSYVLALRVGPPGGRRAVLGHRHARTTTCASSASAARIW